MNILDQTPVVLGWASFQLNLADGELETQARETISRVLAEFISSERSYQVYPKQKWKRVILVVTCLGDSEEDVMSYLDQVEGRLEQENSIDLIDSQSKVQRV